MAFAVRLIPWKYLGVWLGIIVAEIVLIFLLSFYRNGLQNQIYDLENEISLSAENLETLWQKSESLKLLGQYLAIREIVLRRKEIGQLIENFAVKMPKSMQLDSLEIDTTKKILKITGSFDTWENYIRSAAYFRKEKQFQLIDQGSPRWKNNRVRFNWQFQFR